MFTQCHPKWTAGWVQEARETSGQGPKEGRELRSCCQGWQGWVSNLGREARGEDKEAWSGDSGTGYFSGVHEPGQSWGTHPPEFHHIPWTPSVLGQR